MKQYLLIAAMIALAGCGRTEANRQAEETTEQFEKALALRGEAVSGAPTESLVSEGSVTPFSEYRQQKEEAAVAALSSVASRGSRDQKMAANLFISESKAARARYLADSATTIWARQSDLYRRLGIAANAVSINSGRAAKQYRNVSFDDVVKSTNDDIAERANLRSTLQQQVNELSQGASMLKADLDRNVQASQSAAASAESLSSRAFTSNGQQQYDLYVQAADAQRQADRYTADADALRTDLDITQAKLTIAQTRLDSTNTQIDSLNSSLQGIRGRSASADELASEIEADIDGALQNEIGPIFKELSTAHSEQIAPKFEEAIASMTEAVEQAESATGSASGSDRAFAELHTHVTRLALGQILRQRALVDSSFVALLTQAQESIGEIAPDAASELAKVSGPISERVVATKAQAAEVLTQVSTDLTPLAETAQQSEDAKGEIDLRKHLVYVHQGLASVTGDESHATKADEYRQRVTQIRANIPAGG